MALDWEHFHELARDGWRDPTGTVALDLRDRREITKGFGDGMSRAFELVATPAVFAFLGYLLDRRLDTGALFTIVAFLFSVTGTLYVVWLRYDAEMRVEEARQAARRGRLAPAGPGGRAP